MTTGGIKRGASKREKSLSPPPVKKRRVESTTTSGLYFYLAECSDRISSIEKTVSSFFTPMSKKEPEQITWRVVNESLLFARYQPNATEKTSDALRKRRKIAAFDLVSLCL